MLYSPQYDFIERSCRALGFWKRGTAEIQAAPAHLHKFIDAYALQLQYLVIEMKEEEKGKAKRVEFLVDNGWAD